jgi:hypothetical protein
MTGNIALAILLLVVIANFALQPLTEPDFGWHLRAGLDLLNRGLPLPQADPYSHTMPDWPWVEHAWLTDALLAAIYSAFGALGVILFFAAVTMTAWLLAAALAARDITFRCLGCVLSLWVALPYLGARTQLVTLLGLAFLSWMLKRWQDGKESLRWWIPPLFLLWTNLHGGFVAGLLLLGVVIVTTMIVQWLSNRRLMFAGRCDERLFSERDLRRLVVLAVVSAGLTLVNPYGWRLHREIAESLSNQFMLETLQEWQPLSTAGIAGRSYVLYLTLLGVGMALCYRKVEPVRWAVSAVFLLFSVRYMRNIPVFLIMSLPFCVEVLASAYERLSRRCSMSSAAANRAGFAAAVVTAVILWWLGPEHVHRVALAGTKPAEFFRATSYPIEAVDWVRAHHEQTGRRLYNDYAYGGFLLWWLPDTKVFIDGRMPAWQRGEREILRDYLALTGEPPDLSVLTKYAVDWALVKKETPLEAWLGRHDAWHRVYGDDKAVIYRLKATTQAF